MGSGIITVTFTSFPGRNIPASTLWGLCPA